jgi:predicted dehydrogenase
MKGQQSTRREFIRRGLTAGAAMSVVPALSARSYAATQGANGRLNLAVIGCGGRSSWLLVNWVKPLAKKYNVKIAAICDIWNIKRDAAVELVKEHFGDDPIVYKDYRKLLDDRDVDAVIIGTADHQHCGMLTDAVRAGKDVYVEKPIAMNMEELNTAADVVQASSCIVQHGTQGRSCRGAKSARDFIQSGGLGKVIRIEQSRSFYKPYWNYYTASQKKADTDWRAFLYNLPYRPYDKDRSVCWMGYRDYSTGPVGGWMSHFSDFNHYVLGCGIPKSATSFGGVYAPTSVPPRDCPDVITAILDYEEGFTTLFTTHFGNGANDYIAWFGEKGVMRTGQPDGYPNGMAPVVSGDGSQHEQRIKEETALENTHEEGHMENWLRCVHERKQPNAHMGPGYMHGVAVLMADQAYATGRKVIFDKAKREIRPA